VRISGAKGARAREACLAPDTLVQLSGGSAIEARSVRPGMHLVGQRGEPVPVVARKDIPESDMYRLEYRIAASAAGAASADAGVRSSHSVSDNHLVTLRWARNPSIDVDTVSSNSEFLFARVGWMDGLSLQPMAQRFRFHAQTLEGDSLETGDEDDDLGFSITIPLPSLSAAAARSFCLTWLAELALSGHNRPLYVGDLIDIPAERLHELFKNTDVARSCSLPLVSAPTAASSSSSAHSVMDDVLSGSLSSPVASAMEISVSPFSDLTESTTAAAAADTSTSSTSTDATSAVVASVSVTASSNEPCIDVLSSAATKLEHRTADEVAQHILSRMRRSAASSVLQAHMPSVPSAAFLAASRIVTRTADSSASDAVVAPTAGYAYTRPSVDDAAADFVYVLPQHHALDSNSHNDDRSLFDQEKKSFAISQLERAWAQLGIDISASMLLLSEWRDPPTGAPIDSIRSHVDGDDGGHSLASMTAALALEPKAIVVFGAQARMQWCRNFSLIPLVRDGEVILEQGRLLLRLHLHSGYVVVVHFSPHPAEGLWLSDVVATLAAAHGGDVLFSTITERQRDFAMLDSVALVRPSTSIAIEVSGADKRFLLADKVLTHNCSINQSLSALGNVISALTEGNRAHIPYRDSRLTRLLEDSFGGNVRATLLAMVSPAADSFLESLSTLKFAHRAKHIQNEARINEDLDEKALLRRYERELKKLRSELQAKSKNVVDKRKLIEVEEQRRRAEADRTAALATLELLSKDLLKEKSSKKQLEERIKEMNSQLLVGGLTGGQSGSGGGENGRGASTGTGGAGGGSPDDASSPTFASQQAFQQALQQEQERIRAAYASKLAELESERQGMEEEKAQTSRYKQLLLKQRDIMIQLTARLNERDQSILLLQEELDGYDRHQRAMEDELDAKRHRLIQLQRMNAAGSGGGMMVDPSMGGGGGMGEPSSPSNSGGGGSGGGGANLYGLFPIDEAPYFEDNALSPIGSPSSAGAREPSYGNNINAASSPKHSASPPAVSSSPSSSSPSSQLQHPLLDPSLLEQEVSRRVSLELNRLGGSRDDALKMRVESLQDALERKSSESLRLREELQRAHAEVAAQAAAAGGGGSARSGSQHEAQQAAALTSLHQSVQERDAQLAALQAQNAQLSQSVTALQMMLQNEKAHRSAAGGSSAAAASNEETRALKESLSSLRRKHDVQLQERAALKVILEKKMKALIDSIANAALHGVVPPSSSRSGSSASPGPDSGTDPAAVRDALPARTKREIEVLQRLVEASLTALKNADSSAGTDAFTPPPPSSSSASPAPSPLPVPQRSPSPGSSTFQQPHDSAGGYPHQRAPSSASGSVGYAGLPLSASAPRNTSSASPAGPSSSSSSSYRPPPTASVSLASSAPRVHGGYESRDLQQQQQQQQPPSSAGVTVDAISARLQSRRDELQRLDEREHGTGGTRER
jgi:hypothetical protein